jgi:hypothetical protein
LVAIVAEEAARVGRRRNCRAEKFVKWAEQVLRGSRGDLERLTRSVSHKILWLVYAASPNAKAAGKCYEKARKFVRANKRILAEQVLAGNVMEDKPDELRPLLLMPGAMGVVTKVSRKVIRSIVNAAKERLKVRNAQIKKAR